MFAERLITGKTVVLVTHSMDLVRRFSDRALLMDKGTARLIGDPAEVIAAYEAL